MKIFDQVIKQVMVEADKGSFGVKDKILLFKELWNLLRWGVGIADALALLEQNSDNYATRIVMNTLREEIINGKNLSRSLKKFPKYFDETDIATIQSWEKSGNLDDILLMIGWGTLSSIVQTVYTLRGRSKSS